MNYYVIGVFANPESEIDRIVYNADSPRHVINHAIRIGILNQEMRLAREDADFIIISRIDNINEFPDIYDIDEECDGIYDYALFHIFKEYPTIGEIIALSKKITMQYNTDKREQAKECIRTAQKYYHEKDYAQAWKWIIDSFMYHVGTKSPYYHKAVKAYNHWKNEI